MVKQEGKSTRDVTGDEQDGRKSRKSKRYQSPQKQDKTGRGGRAFLSLSRVSVVR